MRNAASKKEARLVWKKPERGRRGEWIIRDGPRREGTGIHHEHASEIEKAKALTAYAARHYQAPKGLGENTLIAEVMAAYLKASQDKASFASHLTPTANPIIEWWGDKKVAEINDVTCKEYESWRRSQFKQRPPRSKKPPQRIGPATARHDLKTLRSAINYYRDHIDRSFVAPKVTLPSEPPPRMDYFLTRKDMAGRIRAARRNPKAKHLVRALLIGIYTGTRPGAVRRFMSVRDAENGWIDLASNTIHRIGYAKPQTKNKLQTPVRIHKKLRWFLERWRKRDVAAGMRYVIHFNGNPVDDMQRCWHTTKAKAGFLGEDHGPHILRHSCATWMMQQGIHVNLISEYLGMSIATLLDTYGHHHPDYQQEAASFTGKQRRIA